ncbi:MAG TPA: OmpA family protein, partial [Polyangiaceae bacterium]|nr:OmpA family protein [Polyangiaceae bacterium]
TACSSRQPSYPEALAEVDPGPSAATAAYSAPAVAATSSPTSTRDQKEGPARNEGEAPRAKSLTGESSHVAYRETGRPDASLAPTSDAGSRPAAPEKAAEGQAGASAERTAVEAIDRLAHFYTLEKTRRGHAIRLPSDELFAPGQSALSSHGKFRLDSLAKALRDLPAGTILVEAFTDNFGRPEANVETSERRAQALRDYLVTQGVPAGRLRAEGKGGKQPIGSNATVEGRTLNRRIEITITP